MKLSIVVMLGLLAVASAKFTPKNDEVAKQMWEDFKELYDKSYATEEEEYRRHKIFLGHLSKIDERNFLEGPDGATHGITRFLDLSEEEFKAQYLGHKRDEFALQPLAVDDKEVEIKGVISKDWTGVLTTPVKDQAQCGSCWAFSATEQIESDTMRELNETFILSPQQIVSCDKGELGCNGGDTINAYQYVKKAGGIVLNKDYKYTSGTGNTGKCLKKKISDQKVTVDGYTQVRGESNMAQYVGSTGPLSICLAASTWQTYTGGILKRCDKQVDHCVQAVGVDTGKGYWKVRNSWNTDWGESGFIRLAYGKNTCAITTEATWVKVSNVKN